MIYLHRLTAFWCGYNTVTVSVVSAHTLMLFSMLKQRISCTFWNCIIQSMHSVLIIFHSANNTPLIYWSEQTFSDFLLCLRSVRKKKQPTFQVNILHCLKCNNQASEYLVYFITRVLDNYSPLYTLLIIMCACVFVCESVWPNYLTNYVNVLVCVYVYEGNAHEKQITQWIKKKQLYCT